MCKKIPFHISFALLLISCSPKDTTDEEMFNKGVSKGVLSPLLHEASGLAASISNSGYFWSHNDSGNPPEVFLLDENAEIKMTILLKGATNRDWEDITITPGPAGKNYIYVGDIGDNEAKHRYKYIYRFEEPVFDSLSRLEIDSFDRLVIKLPDGARDSEALTVNPVNGLFYIFSKREAKIGVYEFSLPVIDGDTIVPQKVCTIPIRNVTAANISDDGTEILLKNYENIFYWHKSENETMAEAIQRPYLILSYDREPQGEAISFSRDGSGFYTVSETTRDGQPKLLYYKRKKE